MQYERERRRGERRGAHSLQHPAGDQQTDAWRGGADRRSGGEERHAHQEDATPPKPVGPSPGADHAGGDDDRVPGEDPRQRGGRYVGKIAADVAEGDVEHHRIEADHERSCGHDGETGPRARRDRDVGSGRATIHGDILYMIFIILRQLGSD